jgi:thymidylate synthase
MEHDWYEPRAAYVGTVHWVRSVGTKVKVRGLQTRETFGQTIIIPDVTRPILPIGTGRKVNSRFAAVDALALVGGVDADYLRDVAAPGWRGVLIDPEHSAYGAYGPRTRTAVPYIYRLLREDPTSRRAVAAIWRPVDLETDGDRPCTLFLQFLLRDSYLHLISTMRSQDVFLGLAYDLWSFTQLQLTMARWLNAWPGSLTHHVSSLHLYDRDLEAVDMLTDPKPLEVELPQGVVPTDPRLQDPVSAALALLSPEPSPMVQERNPWYAQQLNRVRTPLPAVGT